MINSGLIAGAEWSCHLAQQRAKKRQSSFVRSAFINMQNIISLYGTLRASLDSFECVDTQRSLAALEMMMLEVLELVWALA